MKELPSRYDPKTTETKWLDQWLKARAFHATAHDKGKPYTIVIPPPNVTGVLHMGHALNNTLQDIVVRFKRMNGFDALWMPGTDHAGIATQNVVEKQLAKKGTTRQEIGREKLLERLWEHKQKHGDTILHQLEKLGASCDWDRTRFTMDDDYSEAVKQVFVKLYEKDLIYQGKYIINWCPRCETALSDEEAEHQDHNGKLYHIRYEYKDKPGEYITVATTRPETYLGDTAVAVNPKDERYKDLIGQKVILPIIHREIPIITDDFVDPEFGTGMVKVTPAHDPNDFAMGQRHDLPMINVMHPNGIMNKEAGPFEGQNRFEARKNILKELEKIEALSKVDEHQHAVGHCYRCDDVVEPYLSKQWFVRMKPLADRALEQFKQGRPRIQPKRWEKVYENWLTDIRDWCISRQIWWGHRIPVWYDSEGNAFVAHDYKEAQEKAKTHHGKEVDLTQDEDVLDTWFSSWLWPFATLGWPNDNKDLQYFYPTQSLFTAPEIIFFWVARMVMAGLEFMDDVPFDDVVLHGTVRDEKGRKMSKSLGNSVDPLEIIEEFGADALRFSMILNSGQDIYISKDKFEIGRNFCNKLWNATRLVLMNINDEAKQSLLDDIQVDKLDLASQWILSRLSHTLREVETLIEEFRYSEALSRLYEFFWTNYCDWYLEIIKDQWADVEVQKVAFNVLENIVAMLHPFIPFVTEEIYAHLRDQDKFLTNSSWPRLSQDYYSPQIEDEMNLLMEFVTSVRTVRGQWNITPKQKVVCHTNPGNSSFIVSNEAMLKRLAGVESFAELEGDSMPNAAMGYAASIKYAVPLGDLIDIEQEKKRIEKQIEQQQNQCDRMAKQLSNENFLAKAPQEIIAQNRENIQNMEKVVKELKEVLKNFS